MQHNEQSSLSSLTILSKQIQQNSHYFDKQNIRAQEKQEFYLCWGILNEWDNGDERACETKRQNRRQREKETQDRYVGKEDCAWSWQCGIQERRGKKFLGKINGRFMLEEEDQIRIQNLPFIKYELNKDEEDEKKDFFYMENEFYNQQKDNSYEQKNQQLRNDYAQCIQAQTQKYKKYDQFSTHHQTINPNVQNPYCMTSSLLKNSSPFSSQLFLQSNQNQNQNYQQKQKQSNQILILNVPIPINRQAGIRDEDVGIYPIGDRIIAERQVQQVGQGWLGQGEGMGQGDSQQLQYGFENGIQRGERANRQDDIENFEESLRFDFQIGIDQRKQLSQLQEQVYEYQNNIQYNQKQHKSQKPNFHIKGQTKNIIKNFGRSIITFIEHNKPLLEPELKKVNKNYQKFLRKLKKQRKSINTIQDLRMLWTCRSLSLSQTQAQRREDQGKIMRTISQHYLRKRALSYVFNSNVQERAFGVHIQCRRKFLHALRNPWEFCQVK